MLSQSSENESKPISPGSIILIHNPRTNGLSWQTMAALSFALDRLHVSTTPSTPKITQIRMICHTMNSISRAQDNLLNPLMTSKKVTISYSNKAHPSSFTGSSKPKPPRLFPGVAQSQLLSILPNRARRSTYSSVGHCKPQTKTKLKAAQSAQEMSNGLCE